MSIAPQLSTDGKTLRIRVPMKFTKRGGRKLIVTPINAAQWEPPTKQIDKTIVKALARGFRWRRMLESGDYGSISELAKAEKINQSYLCRMMRLTLLAPDIVQLIMDGKQPPTLQLSLLQKPFPNIWERQRNSLKLSICAATLG